MDDDKINKFFTTISEQMLALSGQLSELRASVNVLKVIESMRLNPVEPIEGLKALRQLEEKQQALDPSAQELKDVSEMIEALKLWKNTSGGRHHEA